ncbi:hypothetical protein ARMGADRAFT_1038384 [Armillaria gallica]|uniref:Uncharacterized protein n=1 Tax=Armillaria gallica TaxID=47427 RepID=A0A2H3CLE8_ARMGA|nr:hypothetical protein ARMGADRAFT_1038384 [Armillaria gallica]
MNYELHKHHDSLPNPESHVWVELLQSYAQFSVNPFKGKTVDNSGNVYKKPYSLQRVINIFHDECAPYHVFILNKVFASATGAVSLSDPRDGELSCLQEVERDLALQYGELSGSDIDSVAVFQVVKARAFRINDEKSILELRELDKLLKLCLELKMDAPPIFLWILNAAQVKTLAQSSLISDNMLG